ncbi:Ypt/Rab-GAP domain of gyp1p superfamily protein [Trifolium repens]|nr:Ypt/Rab-GAP domain of gyp1p superfamily protein [Trifolium repens]
MAKKRVPDWLNSPLWSSPSEQHRFSSAVPEPPEPPSPPPLTIKQDPPSIQHSRTNHNHNAIVTSSSSSSSASTSSADENSHSRQAQCQANLLAELSRKVIDMRELRRIASQGIPDVSGLRSTVWKILLGYLPPDRGLWSSELAKKRSQYKRFKQEILINPSEITRRMFSSGNYDADDVKCETRGMLSRSQITHGEHPLSLGKTSIWNQFFQDTDIIEQIDRDVKRTHPDMPFFCGDSQLAKSNQEALKNILIIFAKLNPGIRYVQGMNEVLAPLFYVFKNDPDEENAAFSEADTFFCFVELLSGFRDNFCQQLDNSIVGIRSTIARLSQLLKEHDEELWRHLEVTTKVNPQFYAFRWITLLLTQEFSFADSLRIWDTLIGDPDGPQETLLRVCCAMLILVRRRLLAGDFTSNLKLLQRYPSTNISHLLHVANKLRVQPV